MLPSLFRGTLPYLGLPKLISISVIWESLLQNREPTQPRVAQIVAQNLPAETDSSVGFERFERFEPSENFERSKQSEQSVSNW